MPKTFTPFIEVTRDEGMQGYATISLINVDNIRLIRCMDDGRAEVHAQNGDVYVPVEPYSFFVTLLTELTTMAETPIAKPAPATRRKKRA